MSIQPFRVLLIIIVFSSAVITLMLGNWQIARRAQKLAFIEQVAYNISNPPIHIKDKEDITLYSKVQLFGKFINEDTVFLYGRRTAMPDKDGYYILTPFTLDNGITYLVSRGWISKTHKENLTLEKLKTLYSGNEEINAIAMPGEKSSFFMPANDPKSKVWITLDLILSKEKLSITENDFYLMQIGSNKLPEGALALFTDKITHVRNDHLEYAITWYIMSLILFGIFIYMLLNNKIKWKKS